MRLVCLTGIDGTGKTTLAHSTVAALRAQGIRASYVYGRTIPVLSRFLMALGRATLLRKHDLWQDYGSYVRSKGQAMRLPFLAWPYVGSVWLDYLVQIWFKLLFHLPGQGIIVLDRYLYDTVINDLAVHLNYSSARMMRAIGRGLKLLPRPMVTILLDLPVEVAFARKTDVPHVDYLRERYSRYLELCTRPEVERLDGEALPKDLVDAVLVRIAHSQSGGTAQ